MRLELSDLRLFLAILEGGSITAGAAHSHLALASASERLRRIEASVGSPLLRRHARGVTATEAGLALAHHARLIVRQQCLLRDELEAFAAGARGRLVLYANTAAVSEFLPSRLAPWLAARPRLDVVLKERSSRAIVSAISSGQAEAGLVSDAIAAPGLHQQAIADDPLTLILPRGHPLASAATITLAELLDQPFVGLSAGSALQDHLDGHARAAGGALMLRVRMPTFDGMAAMVADGVGLGIMPLNAARRCRGRHRYRLRPLADTWARRKLCLCFADANRLSAAMRSLLLHLGARP